MENPYLSFLPKEVLENEKPVESKNPYLDFIPNDAKRQFSTSSTADPYLQFYETNKDFEVENPYLKFLPKEVRAEENKYSSMTTLDKVGFALKLGIFDTFRGVKQMSTTDEETLNKLKADQKKLYELMQGEDGGLISLAYFGGAILDPATWLLPVAKARTLYKAAKYGFVNSGIAGFFGYVDEDNPLLDTRAKQTAFAAAGGTVLGPVVTKIGRSIAGKKTPLGLPGTDTYEGPTLKTVADTEMLKVKLQNEAGEKDRDILARKKIEVDEPELIKDLPSDKARLLRGHQTFFRDYVVKPWQDRVGRPTLNYLTKGEYGAELGTGVVGGFTGFLTIDEDDTVTQKFGRVFTGALTGGLITRGAKKIELKRPFKSPEDKTTVEFRETLFEYLGRNFVDGYRLPSNYKKLRAEATGHENHIASRLADIATKVKDNLTKDESKILFNMLEGDVRFPVKKSALNNLKKEARDTITEIAQEYVDLGLLKPETFKKNKEIYLKRSYVDFEDTRKFGEELRLRGAGPFKVLKSEYRDIYKKQKAYTTTSFDLGTDSIFKEVKGPKKLIKGHKGWELLNLSKKQYQKLKDNDIVEIRWEYTKPQRIGLGEIEDASYALAETARGFSRTLSQFKFFDSLSKQEYVYKNYADIPRESRNFYKQMPTTKLQDSDSKFRYGNLAGYYVPDQVYKDLIVTARVIDIEQNTFYKNYRKLNSLWKVSKTAWNPTVHVNNIMSNIVLHDLVDADYKYLAPAFKALRDHNKKVIRNGKEITLKSELVQEAQKYGVFDADFISVEIKNLKSLSRNPYLFDESKGNPFDQSVSAATSIYKELKSKNALTKLTEWYRLEDSIFRLSVFQDRLAKGMDKQTAALDARRAFIDYNIDAPAINWMRNSITPFIAYTYRIVPLLGEAAIMRPWKYAKWAALGFAINGMGDVVGGGDEEAERAVMPERKQGRIFSMPFLPYRNIKLPGVDLGEKDEFIGPTYIDITRFVPGGDIFDLGQPGIPGIPAPLQPSFGLAGDIVFPLLGYDLFRMDRLRGKTGIPVEDFGLRVNTIREKLTPNLPFIPGTFSNQRIEGARRGLDSGLKTRTSELGALFNSFGFKVDVADIDKLTALKSLELQRKITGFQEQINLEIGKFRRGLVNRDTADKSVDKIADKIRKLADQYNLKFEKAEDADIKQPLNIPNPFTK